MPTGSWGIPEAPVTPSSSSRREINVRGVVQGVGFRPFVYRLAREHGLTGWVLNHSGGVEIEVEGTPLALDLFECDLEEKAPPLARIEGVESATSDAAGYVTFEIRHSVRKEGHYQLVSPDIATCADCRRELLDPADRRYRYPFTNCTNCGPRFTIITDIPYDRPLTTMRDFAMCAECQTEYDDPLDRRFHAQPNACPVCGPEVWFQPSRLVNGGQSGTPGAVGRAEGEAAMRAARDLVLAGGVLAIKGLGGFHLACNATDEAAVQRLRDRKVRPAKPLAVMIATMEDVRRHCVVSEEEQRLLASPQCPIVLLAWRRESTIVPLVAPSNHYLGVMLPYTPLHHVLLRDVERPLVMTSGNLSEEPIACGNDEALRRLSHLADGFLLHNRDIHARYDDSVWFVPHLPPVAASRQPADPEASPTDVAGCPQPIRRSRGFAPFPIKLPFSTRQILACGPELKNTFCLTRDDYAFVSQHIGDMENLETLEHFEAAIELYKHLFRIEPEFIAHDAHPAYLSTRYAMSLPVASSSRIPIQHHHAHIASCLADNGWAQEAGPVIGVAWDGTGFGADGRIWGGEFLVADYARFRRAGHLEYMPMPGGEAAIRSPYRLAAGYLHALTGQTPPIEGASEEQLHIICQQVDKGINCPLTSAGGRLFDAVSALLGVRARVSYEAQAAMELEAAAQSAEQSSRELGKHYPYVVEPQGGEAGDDAGGAGDDLGDVCLIRLGGMFDGLLTDRQNGVAIGQIAYRFHLTVAEMIWAMCDRIAQETGLHTVALSGGCFQNRLLLALVISRLQRMGLQTLVHRGVPCNDGGISLGQAAIAQWVAGSTGR